MSRNPYADLPQLPTFTLTSAGFADGDPLPLEQVAPAQGGLGRSPQLAWSGYPAATRSFAVTVYDPDAPTASGFWHWALADVPATITSLDAGAGADERWPGLALRNDSLRRAYTGANPPAGHPAHHYWFAVHALDVASAGLTPDATPANLGFQLFVHAIARATLVGVFQHR